MRRSQSGSRSSEITLTYDTGSAHNKTVPLEILQLLANDGDWRARETVATKRKIDSETLAHMARDENSIVRMSVARHRKTPETLRLLLDDPWDKIRDVVRTRLGEAQQT